MHWMHAAYGRGLLLLLERLRTPSPVSIPRVSLSFLIPVGYDPAISADYVFAARTGR